MQPPSDHAAEERFRVACVERCKHESTGTWFPGTSQGKRECSASCSEDESPTLSKSFLHNLSNTCPPMLTLTPYSRRLELHHQLPPRHAIGDRMLLATRVKLPKFPTDVEYQTSSFTDNQRAPRDTTESIESIGDADLIWDILHSHSNPRRELTFKSTYST